MGGGAAQKKQRRYYSGKKHRHTLKIQVLAAKGRIFCVATARGHTHDLQLFRQSRTRLHPSVPLKADLGYLGLKKLHVASEVPHRRHPRTPLTAEQKAHNRRLSCERVVVEHVIRKLKVFRILAERYRNRRKRFGLRVHLIAGIVNYELAA